MSLHPIDSTATKTRPPFGHNPQELPRELKPFYIGASESDIKSMLQELGLERLDQVISHIPETVRMKNPVNFGAPLNYESLATHLWQLSQKNRSSRSFLGHGLPVHQVPAISALVCQIRNLTTAYTPYQPERSQGTLTTLWIYSSAISELTGFEAINASLYDRATCVFEALLTAKRIQKNRRRAIILEGLYPGDQEVLRTLCAHTDLALEFIPLHPETGVTDIDYLLSVLSRPGIDIASFLIPQVNHLGHLENVDLLTDLAHQHNAMAIAVIDPILISNQGLKPPIEFGKKGADIFVAEGQHLCLDPNFGGPGLGIFGIRYNDENKQNLRHTPGRLIGETKDENGRTCRVIIMSTREQHIRREKATSNICSNQSFVASLAGACLLANGTAGLTTKAQIAHDLAKKAVELFTVFNQIELAFPYTPFFHQVVFKIKSALDPLIQSAIQSGIQIGTNVSPYLKREGEFLLMSFSDRQTLEDLNEVVKFFASYFSSPESTMSNLAKKTPTKAPVIPPSFERLSKTFIPHFSTDYLQKYYQKLGQLNVSPDDNLYPLGSCTMKYNPYINDWAAGLPGFTQTHPTALDQVVQGNLELLYHTQEIFKAITGLPGITTQPVAGAQGELVGLKMFQAYHADRAHLQTEIRDIILIPESAHGTNPATATYAGIQSESTKSDAKGIILIKALPNGEMDFEHLQELVNTYQKRIIGVMVTNPNTTGIFESRFHEMAKLIHAVGGLVYMDGANMNAIAGLVDLNRLGVDAVHNNLHKTWTIPHGGGGPGDAIVAVSEKLLDYLPGQQVHKNSDGSFSWFTTKKCIGSFHRHHGNFAHKVRAYTYLKALGTEGVQKMALTAVLCSQYLYKKLKKKHSVLPKGALDHPRMHEFILTFSEEEFAIMAKAGIPKAQAIGKIGKLFLDFGIHAPTVAFPEPYGLMIEPTESYTKKELDQFIEVVDTIYQMISEHPEVLLTAPHFAPISKVDELSANKDIKLSSKLETLPQYDFSFPDPVAWSKLSSQVIQEKILAQHLKIKNAH